MDKKPPQELAGEQSTDKTTTTLAAFTKIRSLFSKDKTSGSDEQKILSYSNDPRSPNSLGLDTINCAEEPESEFIERAQEGVAMLSNKKKARLRFILSSDLLESFLTSKESAILRVQAKPESAGKFRATWVLNDILGKIILRLGGTLLVSASCDSCYSVGRFGASEGILQKMQEVACYYSRMELSKCSFDLSCHGESSCRTYVLDTRRRTESEESKEHDSDRETAHEVPEQIVLCIVENVSGIEMDEEDVKGMRQNAISRLCGAMNNSEGCFKLLVLNHMPSVTAKKDIGWYWGGCRVTGKPVQAVTLDVPSNIKDGDGDVQVRSISDMLNLFDGTFKPSKMAY